MPFDSSYFQDISDALGLGNPAIIEKDYYVVQLLEILTHIESPMHSLVFSGGTALAKSAIQTNRMSEDIDIKLIPHDGFADLSRSKRKTIRKELKNTLLQQIPADGRFIVDGEVRTRDEDRYFCFNIRYPQEYAQAPFLRPYVQLEFMESTVQQVDDRSISSIYADQLHQPAEIERFSCIDILETQAEKIVSMLRRTACVERDHVREDDQTLVRHIYDTFCIQRKQPSDQQALAALVKKGINDDLDRYGGQNEFFRADPLDELRFGLERLEQNPRYRDRFAEFVIPMVYGDDHLINWNEAFTVFKGLSQDIFELISFP